MLNCDPRSRKHAYDAVHVENDTTNSLWHLFTSMSNLNSIEIIERTAEPNSFRISEGDDVHSPRI